MSKHLICYSDRITDPTSVLLDVSFRDYMKKRLQFWKWRLHRTMGRPVLVLRKASHD